MEKIQHLIILLIFFTINDSILAQNASLKEANFSYAMGDSLFNEGEFEEAKLLFETSGNLYLQEGQLVKHFESRIKRADILAKLRMFFESHLEVDRVIKETKKSKIDTKEKDLIIAKSLIVKGYCWFYQEQFDKVFHAFKEAESRLLKYGHSKEFVEIYIGFGAYSDQISNFDASLDYYDKALNIQLKLVGNDRDRLVAQIYNNIGVTYYYKRNFTKSKEFILKACEIRDEVLPKGHPDRAECYKNIGQIFQIEFKYDSTFIYFDKELNVYEEVFSIEYPNHLILESLNNIGALNYYVGKYNNALGYYQRAINICKKLNQEEINIDLARLYNNIGAVYWKLGQLNRSLEYHKKALEIRLNKHQKNHSDIQNSYANIGSTLAALGTYETALDYLRKALELAKSRPAVEDPIDEINILINIGEVYLEKLDYANALLLFREAERKFPFNYNTSSKYTLYLGSLFSNLGKVHFKQGNQNQSLNYFNKAFEQWSKIYNESHSDMVQLSVDIGQVYFQLGDYDQALRQYQRILYKVSNGKIREDDVFQNPSSLDSLTYFSILRVFHSKALTLEKLYYQSGNLNYLVAAGESISRCDELISILRIEKNFLEDKLLLGRLMKKIYENSIRINYTLYKNYKEDKTYLEKAFYYSEKSKGVTLLWMIFDSKAKRYSGIPDSLIEMERELKARVVYCKQKLAEKTKDSIYFKRTLSKANIIYGDLIDIFKERYPKYYSLAYDQNFINITGLRKNILDDKSCLLSYFVGEKSIYLFKVPSHGNPSMYEIKRDFPLEDWVLKLNDGINGYWLENDENRTDELYDRKNIQYVDNANKIYQQLVGPFLSDLDGVQRLIFIPDDELNFVSFATLLEENPLEPNKFGSHKYLARNYIINYAYSGTLTNEMFSKLVNAKSDFLGFAPGFENSFKIGNERFEKLRFNLEETNSICKLFNGNCFIGEEATKENFLKEISKYKIIHLSTHAKANGIDPEQSFIVLSQNQGKEHGIVYSLDFYNDSLKLNAELVVFSACEIANGELVKGEGVISLARSFIYAGAKSLVATLWKVDDLASNRIIQDYYGFLLKGLEKDQALQKSQINYLHGEINGNHYSGMKLTDNDKHPYFWGAFMTMGDWRKIKIRRKGLPAWTWVLFFAFFVLALRKTYLIVRS